MVMMSLKQNKSFYPSSSKTEQGFYNEIIQLNENFLNIFKKQLVLSENDSDECAGPEELNKVEPIAILEVEPIQALEVDVANSSNVETSKNQTEDDTTRETVHENESKPETVHENESKPETVHENENKPETVHENESKPETVHENESKPETVQTQFDENNYIQLIQCYEEALAQHKDKSHCFERIIIKTTEELEKTKENHQKLECLLVAEYQSSADLTDKVQELKVKCEHIEKEKEKVAERNRECMRIIKNLTAKTESHDSLKRTIENKNREIEELQQQVKSLQIENRENAEQLSAELREAHEGVLMFMKEYTEEKQRHFMSRFKEKIGLLDVAAKLTTAETSPSTKQLDVVRKRWEDADLKVRTEVKDFLEKIEDVSKRLLEGENFKELPIPPCPDISEEPFDPLFPLFDQLMEDNCRLSKLLRDCAPHKLMPSFLAPAADRPTPITIREPYPQPYMHPPPQVIHPQQVIHPPQVMTLNWIPPSQNMMPPCSPRNYAPSRRITANFGFQPVRNVYPNRVVHKQSSPVCSPQLAAATPNIASNCKTPEKAISVAEEKNQSGQSSPVDKEPSSREIIKLLKNHFPDKSELLLCWYLHKVRKNNGGTLHDVSLEIIVKGISELIT